MRMRGRRLRTVILGAVLPACLWIAVPVGAEAPPPPRPASAGPVCDTDALVGVPLPPAAGPGGCGVAAPVEIDIAAGVRLDPPAVVTCGTARALRAWLVGAVKPAATSEGGRLVGLQLAGSYACRGRNGQPGAKLSEHAFGRALDVAALRFADGTDVLVGSGDQGLVARIRAAACGPFATVLGPGSDSFHETHLHLDVAERRSRPYCQ